MVRDVSSIDSSLLDVDELKDNELELGFWIVGIDREGLGFLVILAIGLLTHLIPVLREVFAVLHLGFQIELYKRERAVLEAFDQCSISTGEKIL